MSFSSDVKKEISSRELRNPCCTVAAAYGIACFGRYFDQKGIVLHTEKVFIARWAKNIFAAAGITGRVYAKGEEEKHTYEFSVKDPFEVEKMLALFGHDGDETAIRIHADNFQCEGCFAWFVAAAFLCCGTVVNPAKGYNLEFVGPRHLLMNDLEALLTARGFSPKRTLRKGSNVLYFKASEQIEDMLTFMGATHASLELMSQKMYRNVRNKANRITNCESANIDKTVAAMLQTMRAIKVLRRHNALESLPEQLRATALLREENPELSLAELAEISPVPVSKSGLSHRLRKLTQIADKLEQQETRTTPE